MGQRVCPDDDLELHIDKHNKHDKLNLVDQHVIDDEHDGALDDDHDDTRAGLPR